jgi:hypothetical protein
VERPLCHPPSGPAGQVDGSGLVGELRVWLLAEDGWWVSLLQDMVRWIRAEDLRPSGPDA